MLQHMKRIESESGNDEMGGPCRVRLQMAAGGWRMAEGGWIELPRGVGQDRTGQHKHCNLDWEVGSSFSQSRLFTPPTSFRLTSPTQPPRRFPSKST